MQRFVLIGGGHAHVYVLDSFARRPVPDLEITLVSPFERHHYSGMVPGYLRGAYTDDDLTIDLPTICRASNARFIQAYADVIDGPNHVVEVGSERLSFDLASVDVGSEAAHLDVPGARDHAWTLRPMTRVAALRERLDVLLQQRADGPLAMCVVGAGAAGVEVALALEERTRRAGRTPRVTLFNAGDSILPDYTDALRERADRILHQRGIGVATGRRVEQVEADAVVDSAGERTGSDLTVWLTGAAPPAILQRSALPTDAQGFFMVDATLRSADGEPIWGAGDCIGNRRPAAVGEGGRVRRTRVPDRRWQHQSLAVERITHALRPAGEFPGAAEHRRRQGVDAVEGNRQPLALGVVAEGLDR